MRSSTHTTKGFSLLEVLLVVSILGLLASTIFVMLPRGGSEDDMLLAVQQLRTDLATMRSRARAGEDRAVFGITIATSSYMGFKVVGGATTTFAANTFPAGITATPAVVSFTAINGRSVAATITLTSSQTSGTIQVTEQGSLQ